MSAAVICYCKSVLKPAIHGWLMEYDVDAHGGVGDIVLTTHRSRAKVFASAELALIAWNSIPKDKPLRPDGKPNKPLTAFHMEIMRVPPAPGSWTAIDTEPTLT